MPLSLVRRWVAVACSSHHNTQPDDEIEGISNSEAVVVQAVAEQEARARKEAWAALDEEDTSTFRTREIHLILGGSRGRKTFLAAWSLMAMASLWTGMGGIKPLARIGFSPTKACLG